jgi:hypothetical protein
MRASTAALVLAAVALLAGCSGGTIDPTAAGETTTANATAGETTTANGSANATLAPGLNESGVEDAAALVAAHRAALDETGFAFAFRANVTVGPASQRTVQRGRVEAGLAPLVVNSTSERDLGDGTTAVATDIWANRTTSVVRYDRDDWTRVRAYNRSGDGIGVPDESWAHLPRADLDSQVTNAWLVELALAAGEYDLDRIEERDGRPVAVLRATEPAAAANVTDLDATAVVDREGRVHELSLTAAYEGDEPATRIHYEFELTDLGERSVERPPWVAPALRSGNATAGTPTTATESD